MYVYINKSMKSCSFNISNYSVFYTNTGPSKTLFVWTDLFLDEAKKKKKKVKRNLVNFVALPYSFGPGHSINMIGLDLP